MADHNELGKVGEEVAARYLAEKGFVIVERNWRYNKKELDLIAYDDNQLVIIEVKTRTSDGWEHPKEAITTSKIRFIVEATEAYIIENDIDNEVRFDVVTVIPDNGDWEIEYLKEAFHPGL
ncbi:YraN family protein [Carboxylicivirga caseinilyticus]|uniref:YraN family protein n=1 Tax=Carboxylicivirga caseinilyticus TaxID=3417572 RepID=UPI003D3331D7|nr:YraN family protein [Marinilabiliaceae bacterium A049]